MSEQFENELIDRALLVKKIEQLTRELQETKAKLEKAEKVIQFYSEGYVVDQADWDEDDDADCLNTWNLYTGKRARQYFKDKQGSEK